MKSQLKVLIVEDEVIVSEEISEFLLSFGYQDTVQVQSGKEALHYFETNSPDIVLLDISIKGDMDGIELAQIIRKTHQCAIVFLTAFSDDATLERAKKVHPEAYLVKPFEKHGLYASVNMAFENFNNQKDVDSDMVTPKSVDSIFLKEDHRHVKVMINDIFFLEAQGSYCKVHTRNSSYVYAINLKSAIGRIAHPDLVRAHRSYLVNVKNIEAIEGNVLILGEHKIQMSQSHREEVLAKLNII